jgi:hypothetical protein
MAKVILSDREIGLIKGLIQNRALNNGDRPAHGGHDH